MPIRVFGFLMTPYTFAQALLELSTPSYWGVDYLTSGRGGWDEWIIRTHPLRYPGTQPSSDVDAADLDVIHVFASRDFTLITNDEKAACLNEVDENGGVGRAAGMKCVCWDRWDLHDVWDRVLVKSEGHLYQHELIAQGKKVLRLMTCKDNIKCSVGALGSLSDEGVLFGVPVGLHRQWLGECNRFLIPGAFHVTAVSDSSDTRDQFYQTLIASKKFLMFVLHRRILIVTSAALQSDFIRLFVLDKRNPSVVPKRGERNDHKDYKSDVAKEANKPGNQRKEVSLAIKSMHRRLAGVALRRTNDTVDLNGEPIIQLTLHIWELEKLNTLVDLLIQTPNIARKNVGTNIYLPIRREFIWWHLNVTSIPKSLEEYEEQPSTKISATATICVHHLANNDAAPLKFDARKSILVEDKSFQFHHSPEGAPPDKIIIYCSWPPANSLIKVVLPLLGVAEKDIFFINGSMSIAKRKAAQDKFNAIDGPRVCIISGAAQVGLNLFRANIMIIADTTWSATDGHQLIGRMWRSGQKRIDADDHSHRKRHRFVSQRIVDVNCNEAAFGTRVL
ncbi:hypothetical protein JAAARDRAFT_187296 [Jaapia argillacea MUCL 33604]|uniref:Helicase C-terminal domain-containing protein n=1 Tax=Jaapia argillacea MUCL 33604 TaxID=933084 RepID=A0A067QA93_9AGAM|nr:hypothetical protein JAAARDRAFT_187296 [Jaapia argillacea MUCL 33604]